MLKIDRQLQGFTCLETPTLTDVSISERYHLQEFISNSPKEFFTEICEELFLIGKEIFPSETVQDRIDLLALDKEGQVVIIELKRGNHKLQMFQAISYAGMVAKWQPDDILRLLDAPKGEALLDFLEIDKEEINRGQRIILVAENYDFALLVAAEWLSEQYGVDITCCRISVAKDGATGPEFLVCTNLFPAPELAKQAMPRGRGKTGLNKVKWSDWETALADISNQAIIAFFKQETAAQQESYLRKRILRYRVNGKRRWFLAARKKNAYAWQHARFDDDVGFWRSGLSKPEEVKEVKEGACLRFFVQTGGDFAFFEQAVTQKLSSVNWSEKSDSESDGEDEEQDEAQ